MANENTPIALQLTIALAIVSGSAFPAMASPGHDSSQVTYTWDNRNTDFSPAFDKQFRADLEESDAQLQTKLLVGGLVHPWGIEQLPGDAGFLVTERAGNLRHITVDGQLSEPIGGIPKVLNKGQGGLLDIRTGPTFGDDRMIYWSYSKPMGDGMSVTAAARGKLSDDMTQVTGATDIWVQNPPSDAPMHYGSRLIFPGDGTVFITTGEHFTAKYRDYAQDLNKTYGKVIRVNLDGSIPDTNPFVGKEGDDAIWSLGHRNIQAAAYDAAGKLWIVEHGPKGGDELNAPEPGKNYGWPVVSYGEQYSGESVGSGEAQMEGMEQPVYFWDPVIGPGGMDIHRGKMFTDWNGDMLIGSLYPGGIVRIELNEKGLVEHEERLLRNMGRVRDVDVLRDGSIVFLTDFENGSVMHVTAK